MLTARQTDDLQCFFCEGFVCFLTLGFRDQVFQHVGVETVGV